MASLNLTVLVGNLGADPEMSYTPSGTAKASMRLATNEVWTNNNGETQSRTVWHRIICWGRLAEICGEYLTKGRSVLFVGRTEHRSFTGRDGEPVYITEVIANTMQMLGSAPCTCGKCECRPNIPVKAAADNAPVDAQATQTEDIFPE